MHLNQNLGPAASIGCFKTITDSTLKKMVDLLSKISEKHGSDYGLTPEECSKI